jgi:NADH-quinone oxidoreductase subunit G
MATVYIDERAFEVDAQSNLLEAALSHKLNLPYFCWHPALGSVGACRQCAIKLYRDATDRTGRIAMACMTKVADGMRLSIEDSDARAFRRQVVELLMTNHPHDCPVCEEGGECHLQDMTVMTGHAIRRYEGTKRTFNNQYLGPFVGHEMNRCITCYRCVRFYGDYAGGHDLQAFALRNKVYFGRESDGVLESEFSGNLVEVCPTGVFFDNTFTRRYTRKWDLRSTPSICVHCGVGCNTHPNERYGEVRRILNRYHRDLNGWFLCDRGRFGYDFVNSEDRLRWPVQRRAGGETRLERDAALAQLREALQPRERVVGIGSPRASVEGNFALRTLVGADRFYLGVPRGEAALLRQVVSTLREAAVRVATVRDAESADAVLVLGENVPDTAPRLALALRQATRQGSFEMAAQRGVPHWQDASVRDVAQQTRAPLFVATTSATRLDEIAARVVRGAPDDLVRLGAALLHEIDADQPGVKDASAALASDTAAMAQALRGARRPLIVCGTSAGDLRLLRLGVRLARALKEGDRQPALSIVVPECNSVGLAMFDTAGALDDALDALRTGKADAVVILENDLFRRIDRTAVDTALARARHVVALDVVENETTARANLVLPAAAFAEGDGTLINAEGRAQRFFQLLEPDNDFKPSAIEASWRWLDQAAGGAWSSLDDVIAACATTLPAFARIAEAAPGASFRMRGQRIARESHRASGRTAMRADRTVHEPKPPDDVDSPLSFTMEGFQGPATPAPLIPIFWAPGWNSEQATHRFQQEVNGPLTGGPNGVLLFEGLPPVARSAAAIKVPPAFKPRRDAFLIVALDHVFGSDELAARATAVAARSVAPYLALNPADATRLHVQAGEKADVAVDGTRHRLPVAVHADLPRGVAGIPRGVTPITFAYAPRWGHVSAVEKGGRRR